MAALTSTLLHDQWLTDLRADRAARTVQRYGGAVRHFLAWYARQEARPLALADLTPITLVGYRAALQQTAAARTVNTHVCALRSWCAWLAAHGVVERNPAARFRLVGRQEPAAPSGLIPNEVNALVRAAGRSRHPARDTALVQLFLQTGLRLSECAALAWIDLTVGEKAGAVVVRAGKGNKARAVPLNASVRGALAAYGGPLLDVDRTLKAVAAAWPRRHADQPVPLWRSQKGGRLSASAIWRVIAGLVRDAAGRGLVPPTTSPHTLRHTFARRYLATHPGDLVGLAALLGHSTLETTRLYVHPTADQLAARLEQLDLNAYGE